MRSVQKLGFFQVYGAISLNARISIWIQSFYDYLKQEPRDKDE